MGFLPEKGNARFNFIVGTLNGGIFAFGTAFLDPTTVLPVFIRHFTTSDTLVGLAASLHRAGWHLPQLLVAGYLERRTRRLPVYRQANLIRMSLIWTIVPLLAWYGLERPSLVLSSFLILYGIASLFGGPAGNAYTDIVGRSLPRSHTGLFYASRSFLGGILSILAGILVKYFLDSDSGYDFPINYVMIFALGAGMMSLGIGCFCLVREPEGEMGTTHRNAIQVIRGIPQLLRRDHNFGRFLLVQMLASGIGFSLPFYVVLARETFYISESTVGLFLAIQTIGAAIFNVIWGKLSLNYGNHRVVLFAVLGVASIPCMALILSNQASLLQHASEWIIAACFSPIFLLIGGTTTGIFIGFKSYLLDIAPAERRPTYIGITNTVLGIGSLYPIFGGVLADLVHLQGVFALSATTVLVGFWLCFYMKASSY